MRRFRLSLLGFIALIGFVALGFAALSRPSPILASWCFSLSLAAATIAVIGAVYGRGRRRVCCGGYAIVAWVYLVITNAPWFADNLAPRLITDTVASSLYDRLGYMPRPNDRVWASVGDEPFQGTITEVVPQPQGGPDYLIELDGPNGGLDSRSSSNMRASLLPGFKQIFHSLWSIFAGILGSLIACLFAGRDEGTP